MKADVWFKSTFSNPAQDCVEVKAHRGLVHVRDTKDQGSGPVITVEAKHWPGFIAEVLGHAESASNGVARIESADDGGVRLHAPGVTLSYTRSEWDAFIAGAADGQFDLADSQASAA
ncbi:DUF397 domain-containing protein [Saccharopolyspora sp. NPDC049426]|uniref:DUF397 domain-containing protein n=1 Tax=Saccharopolyspora sp. NPDC049426 TaxID=3155652 RepID=UPI00343F518C